MNIKPALFLFARIQPKANSKIIGKRKLWNKNTLFM